MNDRIKSTAEWVGNTLWIHINGKILRFQDPKIQIRKSGSGASSSSAPDQIKSPMPGRITKVTVKPGDSVLAGQAVVMMEAMKMEYTLKAEVDGKVKSVKIQEADQVNLGQLLVELSV